MSLRVVIGYCLCCFGSGLLGVYLGSIFGAALWFIVTGLFVAFAPEEKALVRSAVKVEAWGREPRL